MSDHVREVDFDRVRAAVDRLGFQALANEEQQMLAVKYKGARISVGAGIATRALVVTAYPTTFLALEKKPEVMAWCNRFASVNRLCSTHLFYEGSIDTPTAVAAAVEAVILLPAGASDAQLTAWVATAINQAATAIGDYERVALASISEKQT